MDYYDICLTPAPTAKDIRKADLEAIKKEIEKLNETFNISISPVKDFENFNTWSVSSETDEMGFIDKYIENYKSSWKNLKRLITKVYNKSKNWKDVNDQLENYEKFGDNFAKEFKQKAKEISDNLGNITESMKDLHIDKIKDITKRANGGNSPEAKLEKKVNEFKNELAQYAKEFGKFDGSSKGTICYKHLEKLMNIASATGFEIIR